MRFIKRTLIFTVMLSAMLTMTACDIFSNQNVAEKIENLGYEVEADGSEYILTDDDTQFVIKVTFGTAKLQSITRELSPHGGTEVVDNIGIITIKPKNSQYVELSLDDTVLETFANGNSTNVDEHIGVVCGTDFSEESIDPYDAASVLGKATKYLHRITTNWMSAEELQALYEEGIDIVNSINE